MGNSKKLKYHIFKKTLSFSIVYNKCGCEYQTKFKGEESIGILKILGLINSIEEYQKIYYHIWITNESRI